MGNSPPAATAPPATAEDPSTVKQDGTSYQWPSNLYEEARDMAAASFLVYTFGYILETARKHPDEIVGLQVDEKRKVNRSIQSSGVADDDLMRSFTPYEVAEIVQRNAKLLAAAVPSEFQDPTLVEESLELLQRRVNGSMSSNQQIKQRPLALVEYDDRHQRHELVYAVAVDRINQRVTLVFRGTDNELAFYSNWATNMTVSKTKVDLPDNLKGTLPIDLDSINLHSGFYNYLFSKTFDDTDDPERTKYDEVLSVIKPLLADNPGYKLYVTGHSLGGALSGWCFSVTLGWCWKHAPLVSLTFVTFFVAL